MKSNVEQLSLTFPSISERLIPPEGLEISIEDVMETPTGFRLATSVSGVELASNYFQVLAPLGKLHLKKWPDQIAIKCVGYTDDSQELPDFAVNGEHGEKTLELDGEVLERQEKIAVPSGFLAWGFLEPEGEEAIEKITLFPSNSTPDRGKLSRVVGLPKFEDQLQLDRVYESGILVPGSEVERDVADQLVKRLISMKRKTDFRREIFFCSSRNKY